MSPLHEEDRQAILGADVVVGNDPHCAAWIRKHRGSVVADAEGVGVRAVDGEKG
jgi:5-methyltetrahydrofolate--homocysteine methyltransferase